MMAGQDDVVITFEMPPPDPAAFFTPSMLTVKKHIISMLAIWEGCADRFVWAAAAPLEGERGFSTLGCMVQCEERLLGGSGRPSK